jgi:GntR family transcriptional regulator
VDVPGEVELSELPAVPGDGPQLAEDLTAELRAADLAETHHGKGTFVKRRPPVRRKSSDRFRRSHRKAGKAAYLAESEQTGSAPGVAVLHVGPTEAPPEIAERLGVTAGAQVLARRRLYFSDGVPTEEATSYLPWDAVKDIPEMFADNPGGGGIYARLEEHGYLLTEFTETVRARLATKDERGSLKLSPGAPVIHLTRNAIDDTGRVVEVCDTVMAADQWVLEYRIPADD